MADDTKNQVIETEVTVLSDTQIRLKFHGLPGDCGPDLIMDYSLARLVVNKLAAVLPEFNMHGNITPISSRIVAMLLGSILTKDDAKTIIDAVTRSTVP